MTQAKDWSPNRVLFELHEKGLSLRSLAARHGIHVSTIAEALYSPYPKCEARIAHALGMNPREIWPSRYASSPSEKRKAA